MGGTLFVLLPTVDDNMAGVLRCSTGRDLNDPSANPSVTANVHALFRAPQKTPFQSDGRRKASPFALFLRSKRGRIASIDNLMLAGSKKPPPQPQQQHRPFRPLICHELGGAVQLNGVHLCDEK